MVMSMYSANAYPLLRPVAESLTRLKALNCPNDMSNSFTYNINTTSITSLLKTIPMPIATCKITVKYSY